MFSHLFCPGLQETGRLSEKLMVVRDGLVNFYVVKANAGLICIDAGWRPAEVLKGFKLLGLDVRDVKAVFLTHHHGDHARGTGLFSEAEIHVSEHANPAIQKRLARFGQSIIAVKDGQRVAICNHTVQVIDTPGHTASSVSYWVDGELLFTGDTLLLRHGRVMPFSAWFNQDNVAAHQSLRRLAGIRGINHLLTSHHGTTRDIEQAFSRWRDACDGMDEHWGDQR